MPSERTEPVAPSCCDTICGLIVRHLRTDDIRGLAVGVLTALGYELAEVEDIVKSAQEAGE